MSSSQRFLHPGTPSFLSSPRNPSEFGTKATPGGLRGFPSESQTISLALTVYLSVYSTHSSSNGRGWARVISGAEDRPPGLLKTSTNEGVGRSSQARTRCRNCGRRWDTGCSNEFTVYSLIQRVSPPTGTASFSCDVTSSSFPTRSRVAKSIQPHTASLHVRRAAPRRPAG